MHEITCDEEGLSTRDGQGYTHVNSVVTERDIGSSYRDHCPEKERVEHEQVSPDMVTELFG